MEHPLFSLATTTTILLLLFFLFSTPPTNAATTVEDVMGEPVFAGQGYNFVPYDYTDVGGGGLTWELKKGGSNCDYYVSQKVENTDFGDQIAFYPQNTRQNEITFSSEVNIAFTTFTPPRNCPKSSNVWKAAIDPTTRRLFIELAGRKGTRDLTTWFTIEDVETGGYKISYCPRNRRADCGDLGIVSHDGGRWLGVNGTSPLTFQLEPEPFFLKNGKRSVPATYNLGTSYAA